MKDELRLKDLYDVLLPMQADVSSLKADMKEHMRRTAAVEMKTASLEKALWMLMGAGSFLTVTATIVAILRYSHIN